MSKVDDYTIGVSPFGNVYLGKQHPTKPEWVGDKKEVTSQFIKCVIDKFGPSHRSEVTNGDGKVTHQIFVLPAGKKVTIDGKEV